MCGGWYAVLGGQMGVYPAVWCEGDKECGFRGTGQCVGPEVWCVGWCEAVMRCEGGGMAWSAVAPALYRIQSANTLKIPVKDVVAATLIFKTCPKHERSIFFLSCVMYHWRH